MVSTKSVKKMKMKMKNGPKAYKAFLEQELKEMESTRKSLQIEINRSQQFEDALRRETSFGELYSRMSYEKKEEVQTRFCNHCRKFSVQDVNLNSPFGIYYKKHGKKRVSEIVYAEWNDLPDSEKVKYYRNATSLGDFLLVPGQMEQLASLFNKCRCMWKRYVARTYIRATAIPST